MHYYGIESWGLRAVHYKKLRFDGVSNLNRLEYFNWHRLINNSLFLLESERSIRVHQPFEKIQFTTVLTPWF